MNDELFRPHGLYCLIMAYDIQSRSDVVQFDLEADPSSAALGPPPLPSPTPGTSRSQARFRSNDGVVGAAEFPASAELVFLDPHNDPPPAYDDGSSDSDNEQSEGSSVKAGPSGGENGFTSKLAKVTDSLQSWQDLRYQRKFVSGPPPFPPQSLVIHLLHPYLSMP